MPQTWLTFLTYAAAGAFMPTWIVVNTSLLTTRKPLRNSGAFILGNWSWRMAYGALALLVAGFGVTRPSLLTADSEAAASVVLAAGAAVWGVSELRRHRMPTTGWDGAIARFAGLEPWQVYVASIAAMVWPGAQYFWVLAGVGVCRELTSDPVAQVALLALFAALNCVLIALPTLAYAIRPQSAEALLVRVERGIVENGHAVLGGVLVFVAAALLYHAYTLFR